MDKNVGKKKVSFSSQNNQVFEYNVMKTHPASIKTNETKTFTKTNFHKAKNNKSNKDNNDNSRSSGGCGGGGSGGSCSGGNSNRKRSHHHHHHHNNYLVKRRSYDNNSSNNNNDNINDNPSNTPYSPPAKKMKKIIITPKDDILVDNDNSNNNNSNIKRNIRWIYPNIPTIIEKLRYNNDLKNIRHKLEDKYNHYFLHNYVDKKELFTKDAKDIALRLLKLYDYHFSNILKNYNIILLNNPPADDEFIDQYKSVYKTFMKILNNCMQKLREMKISYEMLVKNMINDILIVEQAKTSRSTIDHLENRLLYIALFEYYHPVRNTNGDFEYSNEIYLKVQKACKKNKNYVMGSRMNE